MIKHIISSLLIWSISNFAYGQCQIIWEVDSLASKGIPFTLNSELNYSYEITAVSLRQLIDIHKKIDEASGIYTKLLLCNSDDVNAYAFRAGSQNFIAITLGFTRIYEDDVEAYAAVFGHENAHLTLNHNELRQSNATGVKILQLLLGAALEVAIQGSGGASGLGSDLASIGSRIVQNSYTREQELEADKYGLRYMLKAGYSPFGAIRLQEQLVKNSTFFSSHPSSEDRIIKLKEEMQYLNIDFDSRFANEKPSHRRSFINQADTAIGMVIKAKNRLRYYIGSQIGLNEPVLGMQVVLIDQNGEKLEGKVDKVMNGYFSVTVEGGFMDDIVGSAIFIRE